MTHNSYTATIRPHKKMVLSILLNTYENLLRVEANLLMSFDELLETKYESPMCP